MALEDITTYEAAIAEITAQEAANTPLTTEQLKQLARQMDTSVDGATRVLLYSGDIINQNGDAIPSWKIAEHMGEASSGSSKIATLGQTQAYDLLADNDFKAALERSVARDLNTSPNDTAVQANVDKILNGETAADGSRITPGLWDEKSVDFIESNVTANTPVDILTQDPKNAGVLTQSEIEALKNSDAPSVAGMNKQQFDDIYDQKYAQAYDDAINGGATPTEAEKIAKNTAASEAASAAAAKEFDGVRDMSYTIDGDGNVTAVDHGTKFFEAAPSAPVPTRTEIPDGTLGKSGFAATLDKIPEGVWDNIVKGAKHLKNIANIPFVGTVIGGIVALSDTADAMENNASPEEIADIWTEFGIDEIAGGAGFVAGAWAGYAAVAPYLAGFGLPGQIIAGAVGFATGVLAATGVSQAAIDAWHGFYDAMQDAGILPPDGFFNNLFADYWWAFNNPGAVAQEAADWISQGILSAYNAAMSLSSPLVLDLDRDGQIELVSLANATAYWDIDEDGYAEATGWVSAQDGFLAIDTNSDGIITDHSELFGNLTTDGFTDLRLLDSNTDNVINASDTAFSDLLIWQDVNQNGYSEAGELFSLSDFDITSINLNATSVNHTNAGHHISHTSTYTVDDGVSAPQNFGIVDVWFQYDDTNSQYAGEYELDIATLFLPTLRGYGVLPSLHIAASIDNDANDPDSLISLLSAFAAQDISELFVDDGAVLDQVRDIMFRWAGVDDVAANSRGAYVDARALEFLEALTGKPYIQLGYYTNPGYAAGIELMRIFDVALQPIASRLIAQAAGRDLFEGDFYYNPATDGFEDVTGLNLDTLDDLFDQSMDGNIVQDKVAFWGDVVRVAEYVIGISNLSTGDALALETAISDSDNTLTTALILETLDYNSNVGDTVQGTNGDDTWTGSVGNDLYYGAYGIDTLSGGIGDDVIHGQAGNDILNGQMGNDTIYGGQGIDTYKYYAGHGNDIYEEEGTESDTIELGAGITLTDLTFSRITSTSLLITVDPDVGGGSIKIQNQFGGNKFIETIKFSDNSTLSLNTLGHTLNGTSGNDSLYGIRQNYGGSGVDTIYGFDGNDIIYGYDGSSLDSLANSLYGGGGTDTIYGASGIDTIDAGSGNDTVHAGAGVDTILGGDGNDTVNAGTGGDDITGGTGDDTLRGGTGVDVYRFNYGDGNDTIEEEGYSEIETIILGAGITQNMLSAYRPNSGDVKINIDGGAGGSITLKYQTYSSGYYMVEYLQFADNSTLDIRTLNYTLNGTSGNDYLYGVRPGYGGSGVDTINGGDGNDSIYGYDGSYADTKSNSLYGGNGNDYLYGTNGEDLLDGGDGNDTLNGGSGTDTATYASASSGVTVNLATTSAQNTVGSGTDTITNVENIKGSAFNDTLTGTSGSNRMEGGAGDDTLDGAAGTDTLSYGDAASSITISLAITSAQNTGGAGTDTISNFENLTGSSYDDTLTGTSTVNEIKGGNGNDTIYGAGGADNLYGDAGVDTFLFQSTSAYNAIANVKDFILADADKIDVRNLLTEYDPLTELLTDFVRIQDSGANSTLSIDRDGASTVYGWTQIATLEAITGLTDESALVTSGSLIVV